MFVCDYMHTILGISPATALVLACPGLFQQVITVLNLPQRSLDVILILIISRSHLNPIFMQ